MVIFHKSYSTVLHFYTTKCLIKQFSFRPFYVSEIVLQCNLQTSCSRGEAGDIIFTEWKLRFIQNVASCYVLCLTKESVITATLVHAPVCVCVWVCVPRAPHGGLSDTSALESGGGSGLNSLPVRVRTLRSHALKNADNQTIDISH